jgi:hypothetical protein
MTKESEAPRVDKGSSTATWHADEQLLARYVQGDLHGALARSLEAHLPDCPQCRNGLAGLLNAARLAHNRRVVLTSASLPPPGWPERMLSAVGLPDHLARLLVLTPSLRRSWLLATVLVLGVAVGTAQVLSPLSGVRGAAVFGLTAGSAMRLLPFLVVVPLLPLAGVAAAFSRRLDPMHDLAVAAPMSGVRLFFLRAGAVLVTSLVPALFAALLLPGPSWLPAVFLLPTSAVSVMTLAASTALDPAVAAVGAGACWLALVCGLGVALGSPAVAFGYLGQIVAGIILVVGAGVLVARRGQLELGWAR